MRRLAESSRLKSFAVATTVPMIMVKPIKLQGQYITDSHEIHGLVVFVIKIMYDLYELAPLWLSFFFIDLPYSFSLADWHHT
jgi:hypothetical protein